MTWPLQHLCASMSGHRSIRVQHHTRKTLVKEMDPETLLILPRAIPPLQERVRLKASQHIDLEVGLSGLGRHLENSDLIANIHFFQHAANEFWIRQQRLLQKTIRFAHVNDCGGVLVIGRVHGNGRTSTQPVADDRLRPLTREKAATTSESLCNGGGQVSEPQGRQTTAMLLPRET
jgi:hypothetical protein